jgi:hypothetical protein
MKSTTNWIICKHNLQKYTDFIFHKGLIFKNDANSTGPGSASPEKEKGRIKVKGNAVYKD